MSLERDAYYVLQVQPHAHDSVVQAAYRTLARLYHPDGTRPDAARMVEVNAAWELLRTPERRGRYDLERRGRGLTAVGPGRPQPSAQETMYDPWARRTDHATAREADVVDFGRYAGWRIRDLARHDPDYLRWLSRHSTGVRYLAEIARCLPGERVGRRRALFG